MVGKLIVGEGRPWNNVRSHVKSSTLRCAPPVYVSLIFDPHNHGRRIGELRASSIVAYFTAIVTPACDAIPPTLSVTGAADPGPAPSGTTAFTCSNPATSSGADPAYCTVASIPPMFAVTGNNGVLVFDCVTLPVTPAGEVWPSPVA